MTSGSRLTAPRRVTEALVLVLPLLGVAGSPVSAQEPAAASAPAAAAPTAPEAAILRESESTVLAFNAGDAAALAATFLETGEIVDEAGTVHTGRGAITELFQGFFTKHRGASLEMLVEAARPVGETLAVEEGLRRITAAGGETAQERYVVVRSRQGDRWPQTRPQMPGDGLARPGGVQRPGTSRPQPGVATRPAPSSVLSRPSVGGRPTTLPGQAGRPGSLAGGGTTRPTFPTPGASARPGGTRCGRCRSTRWAAIRRPRRRSMPCSRSRWSARRPAR